MSVFPNRSDITINGVKYINVTPIMTASTMGDYRVVVGDYRIFDNAYGGQDSLMSNGVAVLDFGDNNRQAICAFRYFAWLNYTSYFNIQASNDYSKWVTIFSGNSAGHSPGNYYWWTQSFVNTEEYRYWKLTFTEREAATSEIEFYVANPFVGNPNIEFKKMREATISDISKTADDGHDVIYFSDEKNIYLTDKKGKLQLMGTGDYNNLLNKPVIPDPYELPIASATTLGGIKVGSNLTIDENGVLSTTEESVNDYTALINKPKINDVELNGSLTSEDLKITQTAIADEKPTATNINLWVNTTENNIVGLDSDGNEISLITTGGIGINTRGW